MKQVLIAVVTVAGVLALVLGVVHVGAQDNTAAQQEKAAAYTCPMHPDVAATWAATCPKCGMALVKPEEKADTPAVCNCPWCTMARSHSELADDDAAKSMGMSGPMMMRCRMMMRAAMMPHDPTALLALKDELGLTDDQVDKLGTIAKDARIKAAAVLTPEQNEKLKDLAGTPGSMMDMHHQMMRGGRGPCWCPWTRGRSDAAPTSTGTRGAWRCPCCR